MSGDVVAPALVLFVAAVAGILLGRGVRPEPYDRDAERRRMLEQRRR
ncbi:hypothetical protein ACFCZ3_19865 [Cellulosimicrobium cellulans]